MNTRFVPEVGRLYDSCGLTFLLPISRPYLRHGISNDLAEQSMIVINVNKRGVNSFTLLQHAGRDVKDSAGDRPEDLSPNLVIYCYSPKLCSDLSQMQCTINPVRACISFLKER